MGKDELSKPLLRKYEGKGSSRNEEAVEGNRNAAVV